MIFRGGFLKIKEEGRYRMNKLGRVLLVTALTSSMVVAPAVAAPSTADLEAGKAAAESEAQTLQNQLADLLDEIGKMEEKLIATGEKIEQSEKDLKKAEEQAQEQYEAMKLRIKYMYENGQTSTVEALVSAENFSDLVNKAEYVQNVHTYDRKKLQEYVETKEKIEELKSSLEKEQKTLENTQAKYEEEEQSLNATLEEKRAEISNFDQEIQAAAEAAAQEAAARERAAENQPDRGNPGNPGNGGNPGNPGNIGGGGSTGGGGTQNPGGNTSVAQTIVNAAYSQLGVPYVWGGTTPGVGLDCSGLVQYCHKVAGISLPRTSQAQGGCGIAVSSPQPGDMVCYGTHIGIYIGGGKMIHAPKPGDVVKVANVYGSPWYRRCW